jgi:hypothetical protein
MGAPVHYGASVPEREDSGTGETILINRARVDGKVSEITAVDKDRS